MRFPSGSTNAKCDLGAATEPPENKHYSVYPDVCRTNERRVSVWHFGNTYSCMWSLRGRT